MSNLSNDSLFQLIKSLEKSEKRNFKLFATRNSSSEDLMTIKLFDALDKMDEYDENLLLKKNKSIKKLQLSNIKAALYKELLSSLRLLKEDVNIDIVLNKMMDHARILYKRGLFLQSLKMLEKMKEIGYEYNQISFLQQALFLEKKIESYFITRSMEDRAESLAIESDKINKSLVNANRLSNLSLRLYSRYIQYGHARDEQESLRIQEYFENNLEVKDSDAEGFYERLYLYQSYSWVTFIKQDFLLYYRYTQKWVNLYFESPQMAEVETLAYIKGMHNLMLAHFMLQNHKGLVTTIADFENFAQSRIVLQNSNNLVQAFIYLYIAKINLQFLVGDFDKGLDLVPVILGQLDQYELYMDKHRALVFYYKIACLYFGTGDNDNTIIYLNKIINWKVNLRSDLQCYARLLHLIAHYELGNYELLEYLSKSVYRFMAKMQYLSKVEEEIFDFLKKSIRIGVNTLKKEFEVLLVNIKKYEGNRYESRAFMYLDIISWLESKINNVPVQDVISQKYKMRKGRN